MVIRKFPIRLSSAQTGKDVDFRREFHTIITFGRSNALRSIKIPLKAIDVLYVYIIKGRYITTGRHEDAKKFFDGLFFDGLFLFASECVRTLSNPKTAGDHYSVYRRRENSGKQPSYVG